MRTGATSTVVAVILACGLTVHGNPDVHSLCGDRIERLGAVAAGWYGLTAAVIRGGLESKPEAPRPGPTCALLISKDLAVGIDGQGYVTFVETSFAGDLAAITGLAPVRYCVGERITAPEVLLGLAVVRAFNQWGDLSGLLSEVNVEDLENPRVILCGGVTVDMGTGDYRTKISRLRQILLQAPELGISPTRVDMRFGVQVVVQYEETKKQARKEV
jgi:hypothetical protein